MKFGATLRESSSDLPEVEGLFLMYKGLKKELKKLPNREEVQQQTAAGSQAQHEALSAEESNFVCQMEEKLSTVNTMFLDKEEEAVIRLDCLQQEAFEGLDSARRLDLQRRLVEYHGEVLLLVHWSVLAYTATVKILKKHHKRTGLLLKAPHLEDLLSHPFCSTEVMTQLATRAEQTICEIGGSLAWQEATSGVKGQHEAGLAVQRPRPPSDAGSNESRSEVKCAKQTLHPYTLSHTPQQQQQQHRDTPAKQQQQQQQLQHRILQPCPTSQLHQQQQQSQLNQSHPRQQQQQHRKGCKHSPPSAHIAAIVDAPNCQSPLHSAAHTASQQQADQAQQQAGQTTMPPPPTTSGPPHSNLPATNSLLGGPSATDHPTSVPVLPTSRPRPSCPPAPLPSAHMLQQQQQQQQQHAQMPLHHLHQQQEQQQQPSQQQQMILQQLQATQQVLQLFQAQQLQQRLQREPDLRVPVPKQQQQQQEQEPQFTQQHQKIPQQQQKQPTHQQQELPQQQELSKQQESPQQQQELPHQQQQQQQQPQRSPPDGSSGDLHKSDSSHDAEAPMFARPRAIPLAFDILRRTQVALNTWSQLYATASTPSTVLNVHGNNPMACHEHKSSTVMGGIGAGDDVSGQGAGGGSRVHGGSEDSLIHPGATAAAGKALSWGWQRGGDRASGEGGVRGRRNGDRSKEEDGGSTLSGRGEKSSGEVHEKGGGSGGLLEQLQRQHSLTCSQALPFLAEPLQPLQQQHSLTHSQILPLLEPQPLQLQQQQQQPQQRVSCHDGQQQQEQQQQQPDRGQAHPQAKGKRTRHQASQGGVHFPGPIAGSGNSSGSWSKRVRQASGGCSNSANNASGSGNAHSGCGSAHV